MTTKIVSYKNYMKEFAQAVKDEVSKVVRKTAFDIMADAIEHSPVLTGHLKGSNYASPIDNYSWEVGNSAVYAAHVNYGTRFMAARPFFSNAVEKYRQIHVDNVQLAIMAMVNKYAIR